MGILHKYPGVVGAVFAGHDHDGGYNVDAMDIHHIVRPFVQQHCLTLFDSLLAVDFILSPLTSSFLPLSINPILVLFP